MNQWVEVNHQRIVNQDSVIKKQNILVSQCNIMKSKIVSESEQQINSKATSKSMIKTDN